MKYYYRYEIEDPPKEIPVPENSLKIPWIELNSDQCQWGLSNDFYEPASNYYVCCGLQVQGGKGVRRRFCKYHVKAALK